MATGDSDQAHLLDHQQSGGQVASSHASGMQESLEILSSSQNSIQDSALDAPLSVSSSATTPEISSPANPISSTSEAPPPSSFSPNSSSSTTYQNQDHSSSTITMEEQGSLSRSDSEPSELPYAARTPPTFSSVKDDDKVVEQVDLDEIQDGETQLPYSKDPVISKDEGRRRTEEQEKSAAAVGGHEDPLFWQQEQSTTSKPKDGTVKIDELSSLSLQNAISSIENGSASSSIKSPALSTSNLSSPSPHQPPSMLRSSSTSSTSSQAPSPNSKLAALPPPALSLQNRDGVTSSQVDSLGGPSSSSSPIQSSSISNLNVLKPELNSPTVSTSTTTPTTPSTRDAPFSPSPLSPSNSSTQAHAHGQASSSTFSQAGTTSPHPTLTFTSASSSSNNTSTRPGLTRRSASSASSSTSPASANPTTPLSPAPSTSSNGKEKEKEMSSIHSSSSSGGTPTSQSAGGRSPSAISGTGGFFSNFRSNSPKVTTKNEKIEESKLEREAMEKEKRTRSSSTSSSIVSQEQSNNNNSNFYSFNNKSSRESSANGSISTNQSPLIGPVPRERENKDSKEKAQEKERNRRSSSVFEHVGSWIGKKVHSRSESRGSDVSSSSQGVRRTSMLNPGKDSENNNKNGGGGDRTGFGFWSSASASSLALSGSALDMAEEGEEPEDGLSIQPFSNTNVNSARSTPTLSHASPATLGSNSSLKHIPGHSNHKSIDEIEELCSPIEPRPHARRQFSGGGASRRDLSQSRRISVLERVLIQVTEDNERFAVVDVSGLSTAEAIKERMFSKLHLYDEVHSSCRLFRTEIGLSEVTSPKVDDDELLALCMQIGDDKGNLKFLVQQSLTSPPAHGSQAMAPPPPISATASPSPRRRTKDLPFQSHGKSDSLSSSSSIGGALGLGNRHGDVEESSDGHSRVASTLQRRSKAQRRPGTAGQSVAGSSPIESQHAFSEQLDVRDGDSHEILSSSADRRPSAVGSPHFKSLSTTSPPASAGPTSSTTFSSPSSGTRPLARPATSHAVSSSRNNTGSQGWSEGSSSSRPMMQRDASQPFEEERYESSSHDRIRSEEVGPNRNDNLSPQSRQVTPYGSQSNRQSFSSTGSGSADSPSIHNARSLEDIRRLSDGIGSNSSGRRPSSGSQHQEVFAVHPLDQKDGRYPAASISRGSGSAGSTSYQTLPSSLVPGPNPSSGSGIPAPHSLGSQILRQSSADSHLHRGVGGPPPPTLPSSVHDPRMVASPASLVGRTLQSPPMRYANSANPEMYQGNQVPSYGPRPDPGYNHQNSDPRFNPYARPPPARPMPVQGGSFGYGHPQSYYDPHVGPPPSPRPPVLYTNEFGARVNPMVGVRPNPNNGFGSPFPSRPHTYHDGPSSHQQINYRPPPQLQPHPQQQHQQLHYHPQQQQHHPYQQQQGGMKMQVQAQDRDDPFTSAMFPASSSRQVSQFQRAGVASLSPGMTVQESLSSRQTIQPGQVQGQTQPGAHPFGPRDPREQQPRRPQSDYERYERTPLATNSRPQVQQQPSSQQSQPQYYNHPHPSPSSASNPQSFDQQQRTAGQRVGQEAAVQAQTYASGRSSGSSFTSSSSHRRNYSNEDKSILSSTEESAGSAPTSARSSRSGPISPDGTRRHDLKINTSSNPQQQQVSQRSSRESESLKQQQEDETREDLEDIDLLNIRPLPRPPQQGGSPSTPRLDAIDSQKSSEESTINPHWGALYNALSSESQGETFATTSSGGDTLRAAPRLDSRAHSEGSNSTAVPSSRSEYDVEEPNDGGTFASFQSFDDDDDETGTWAQPLQPDLSTLSPVKDKSENASSERTLGPGDAISLQDPGVTIGPGTRNLTASPRRPELRLTIDTPTGSKSLSRVSSPTPQGGLSITSKFAAPAASPGINRRTSFARRESDWAFRPPPEQLYENLDDFFPKHDLDKPVLDATAALGSPLAGSPRPEESPPNQQIQPLSAASTGPGPFSSRTRHKKSIRIVAQDRKKFLERAEQAENRRTQGASQGAGLARRRSTKLWGSKVLEMTPGQDQLTPSSSVNESPSSDSGARPVFKWVKGDLIGKGTYGRVYLALNATTGEMIAVKQVELPRTAHDREDIRQKGVVAALKSEIETLKDLDHPHIVSYLGFEETPEFLSIFLEYVPGGSVGSCLRKHGKFEEPTIQSFLHQILEGLEYLHARGILHRDLKADNILVDFTGTCKISDFGTVRRSDDIYGNVENMSLQGSIFWMAPEVVSLSKKGYSAKVDIWSIGCVVLEMFAGRRPWSDDEAVQAMFKIGAERRAPPIPPDVHLTPLSAHFLKQCFAIEPSERPTAARLLEHRFPYPPPDWRFKTSNLSKAIRR